MRVPVRDFVTSVLVCATRAVSAQAGVWRTLMRCSLRSAVATTLRTVMLAFVISLCSLLSASAQSAGPPSPPKLATKAHVLVDYHTGHVLSSFEADARLHPASLTKVMTVFVAFSELRAGNIAENDQVKVSANARAMTGSRMFVELGSSVALIDLIKGVVVQSGNDASVAVAEHVAGSEAVFVDLMNRYAQTVGMRNSRFANAHGLTEENHYTTAADLALLARTLISQFPRYYQWHRIKQFLHNGIPQPNRNRLLWLDETVDGIKTGYTSLAGYCLAASAERNGMRLVSIVLGASSSDARTAASRKLLEYGFKHFETRQLFAKRATVTRIHVGNGAADDVAMRLEDPITLTFPRGRYRELNAEISVPSAVAAPLAIDQPLGTLSIRLDEQLLVQRPLFAREAVAEAGWKKRIEQIAEDLLQ